MSCLVGSFFLLSLFGQVKPPLFTNQMYYPLFDFFFLILLEYLLHLLLLLQSWPWENQGQELGIEKQIAIKN